MSETERRHRMRARVARWVLLAIAIGAGLLVGGGRLTHWATQLTEATTIQGTQLYGVTVK